MTCCFSGYMPGADVLRLPRPPPDGKGRERCVLYTAAAESRLYPSNKFAVLSAEMFGSLLEISRMQNYFFRQIEFRSQDEYKEDECNAPAGKCAD